MHIPCIEKTDMTFTRLKALTWSASGLVEPRLIQSGVGDCLASLLRNASESSPVVVECSDIVAIADHALDAVAQVLAADPKPLVLVNTGLGMREELAVALGDARFSWPPDSSPSPSNAESLIVYGSEEYDEDRAERILNSCRSLEHDHVKDIIKDSFEPFGKKNGKEQLLRLHSTPLLASGVFNARGIVSDPHRFVWACLQMADVAEKLIRSLRLESPYLLATSLRGGPLAVSLSLLSDSISGIEIVDHMGPRNYILEDYTLEPTPRNRDYVYVGDFMIGGTEVKAAHTYVYCKGGTLRGGVVMGTLLDPSLYGTGFPIERLVDLRECVHDLRYEVL